MRMLVQITAALAVTVLGTGVAFGQGTTTSTISGVVLDAAGAVELGGVTEQVVVSSTSEIVQTQSATISQTITTNQITKLPLPSRSAMDFVTFLPGVAAPAGNRDATINGLPQGVINITLDGINVQDNTNRSSDGFFAIVSPRLHGCGSSGTRCR